MHCGFCKYTDGVCNSCDPFEHPKVKCSIDGEYKYVGAECDALITAKLQPLIVSYDTPCLICGEAVPGNHSSAICDKCKNAVMYIRNNLERDPCEPILD
jgi:hypothetical protein